jgi:hypothetical protein
MSWIILHDFFILSMTAGIDFNGSNGQVNRIGGTTLKQIHSTTLSEAAA